MLTPITTIQDIINTIQTHAPSQYQESYDNAGLIVGNASIMVKGILISLDCTENIIDEAIAQKANLVVCHHPIIFAGLKKINGKNYVEKTIIKAIKHDIAIYACHTNYDNMLHGVNAKIAEKLGLQNCQILQPKTNCLQKLCIYAPSQYTAEIIDTLSQAGAGHIGNYSQCSFSSQGNGTFKPNANSNPKIGTAGGHMETVAETKIEMYFAKHLQNNIIKTIQNFSYYEEKAYEITTLENSHPQFGSGLVGYLPQPENSLAFLHKIKTIFNAKCIKHTQICHQNVQKIAICGGSGSFLLKNAIQAGADMYISADFKYHEFFDAENQIIIADIGHYESEQYTSELFLYILREKFTNFAIQITAQDTNPINYL